MSLRTILRADFDHFLRLCNRREGAGLWRIWLNPRTLPVALIRLVGRMEQRGLSVLATLLRLLILWWFRVEIPSKVVIGAGFVLPHPGGIVLGAASIGENVVVFQNVTLGARYFDGQFDLQTRPVIGDNVTIGVGAVVLGPVTIGKGATVAANSLVIRDVAAGATAMGVPSHSNV